MASPALSTPSPAYNPASEGLEVLAERGGTYGDFSHNSLIAQQIKMVLRNGEEWWLLTAAEQEALDMMASKMSRIVTKAKKHADNWLDIEGYARLVRNRIA